MTTIFTMPEKQKQADLLAKLALATTAEEFTAIQTELLELNIKKITAEKDRAENIKKVYSDLTALEISFAELMTQNLFSVETVKSWVQAQNWYVAPVVVEATTSTKDKKEKSEEAVEPLYIGVFNFADYGFTMPFNKDGTKLMGNGETSLNWDWNKRYGGLSWQQKFINAIKTKGYEQILEKATPEFKSWLMEFKIGSGPAKDKEIFENKREFLKMFDIKPADADKIVFDFPTINKEVEEVRVVDEFAQEAPVEVEAEVQEFMNEEPATETVAVEEEHTDNRKGFFGKKKKSQ